MSERGAALHAPTFVSTTERISFTIKTIDMKNQILVLLMTLSSSLGFGQHVLKIQNGHLKMSGSTSLVLKDARLVNNSSFTAATGTVHLTGSAVDSHSAIAGDSATTFYNLKINKSSNGAQLEKEAQVNNELQMASGNLNLNGHDLTLGNTSGTITGESATSRVVGPNGGELLKTSDLNSPNNVNPGNIGVSITSSANLGSTTVRRGHQVKTVYGTGGTERYFTITPTTNDNLGATARFHYFDAELNGITETDLEPVREVNPSWHYYAVNTADQTANYVEAANINAFSTWTLVKGEVKISPKIFLEGPYSGSSLMDDGLRTGNHIPASEPYTALTGFAHTGTGGSEKLDNLLLGKTGNDAVVDWVFLELRDKNNAASVLHTRAALIQRDGDIVGLNGRDPVVFPAAATDDYYLTVRHRNHLGVLSAVTMNLNLMGGGYDFSSSAGSTEGGANGIADLGGGVYGLFSGDFDSNSQIQNTDASGLTLVIGTSGYVPGDADMNGQVQNTDLQLKLRPNIGRGAQYTY